MATAYTDTEFQVYALQARTDSAGAAVDDVTGEDLRVILQLFSPGVRGQFDYRVRQRQAGANMTVDVGSGTVDNDLAVVAGTDPGQGNYAPRMTAATVNVTVPAAHLSQPRLDQVFLIVADHAYDGSSRVLPRLAYRDGTPAASPVVPGPDAAWNAHLLLAEISVPAGDTAITDSQITDRRTFLELGTGGGGQTPTGALMPFAGATAPAGYLLCDGSAVSRTTYARLFAVIGTVWGAGDGSTTFNLPDMRGRYARGVAVSGDGDALGEGFGSDTMLNHLHPVDPPNTTSAIESQGSVVFDDPGDSPSNPNLNVADADHTHATNIASFNSGNPTTNPSQLPLSRAVNYIIKT